jgi:hypothetical protein
MKNEEKGWPSSEKEMREWTGAALSGEAIVAPFLF